MTRPLENRIAVSARYPQLLPKAEALAHELNLIFIPSPESSEAYTYEFLLLVTADYLGLHKTTDRNLNSVFHIDFLSGKMRYRYHHAGLRSELLARAMGTHPRDNPVIIDATAGLGRDSFILASLGFEVIMLERSPILCCLLQDAMIRARQETLIAPIIDRMHLFHADAIYWLPEHLSTAPDIIYLDPMFPARQKSASVKKEMLILQALLENEDNEKNTEKLFKVALSCASRRVVVKRPRLVTNIMECAPNFSIKGKSSRFDVYLVQNK